MSGEKKITKIPSKLKLPRLLQVAIYCRVSTARASQEESLEAQIEHFKSMISMHGFWVLADVYKDVASGRNTKGRPEFQRLMADCVDGKVDLILSKSISRFGRNTVDILENIYRLRNHNVDAFFEVENMRISETHKDFLLSILSGLAQADSESRSQNIKVGLTFGLQNGTSKLYRRPCYGYKQDADGNLLIDDDKAKNVRLIFDLYLQGHSVLSVIKVLAAQGIHSPSGKETWSKRAVETLLQNEKYIGKVLVGKTYSDDFPHNKRHKNCGERVRYIAEGLHEPIIAQDIFEAAQQERVRRSNLRTIDGAVVRNDTHYSMKRDSGTKDE